MAEQEKSSWAAKSASLWLTVPEVSEEVLEGEKGKL